MNILEIEDLVEFIDDWVFKKSGVYKDYVIKVNDIVIIFVYKY